MNYIDALLSFYRVVVRRTVSIIRNNQSFNLAILGNFVIVFAVEIIHLQFYPLGNLPALFIWIGCASCGLHLIESALRNDAINKRAFIKGFSLYFLPLFVWFMVVAISIVILRLAAHYSGYEAPWFLGEIIYYGSLLLPIAEFLYQSRIRGLQICSGAFRFIRANWVEWLIPHALLFGIYMLVTDILTGKEYPSLFMSYLLWVLFYGPFLNFMLIIRGVLFAELSTSTRQTRMAMSVQQALNN